MTKETINELAEQIHATAVEKGWWDDENRNIREVYMLIITELAEAVEADREDRTADTQGFKQLLNDVSMEESTFKHFFHLHIKDTLEDELADVFIRCLDYMYFSADMAEIRTVDIDWGDNFAANIFYICKVMSNEDVATTAGLIASLAERMGIDLKFHVRMKMRFNGMREKMHGGKKY